MRKTVLITGASSGIGFELAKLFAQNNFNLVLVASNKEKLLSALQKLKRDFLQIRFLVKDLANPDSPEEIYQELQRKGITINVLVNNAGFGTSGEFTKTDLQEELAELQVNIVALTHLTKLFVIDMVKRGQGQILNVASTAAFLPGPLMAVYYASKAYVLSFSEALSSELEGTGVSVCVLCPGPTKTDFFKRAHLQHSRFFQGKSMMETTTVAKIAYQGLMAGRRVIIPGIYNKLMIEAIRFVPKSLLLKIFKKLQKKNNI